MRKTIFFIIIIITLLTAYAIYHTYTITHTKKVSPLTTNITSLEKATSTLPENEISPTPTTNISTSTQEDTTKATTTSKTTTATSTVTTTKKIEPLSKLLATEPYTNIKHTYKIFLPKDWNIDPKKSNYFIDAMFIDSKIDKEGTLQFRTNINTGAVPLKTAGISDLDHCVTAQKLAMLFTNYTSTRDTKEILNGTEVRIIGGTYDYGEYHLQNVQLLSVKNGLYYDVTATMLASQWNAHKDEIEASLRSLIIE